MYPFLLDTWSASVILNGPFPRESRDLAQSNPPFNAPSGDPPENSLVPLDAADLALDAVEHVLAARSDLPEIIGNALRQSFDEVIDGTRTGRYRIEQLEKTEKTYIGTKVEIVLRNKLALPRGAILDNLIAGYEVDTKFSLSGSWMIPREAVDQICLLVAGNDTSGTVSAGLLRMTDDVLTTGTNQDGKRNVSAAGKRQIRWLLRDVAMPRNFLLDLDDETRESVLSPSSGKQRVTALFRNVTGKLIPRSAILQVTQLQGDPLKRAREAKTTLAAEGFEVLCATYLPERDRMIQYGFHDVNDDDWLSMKIP